MPATTTTMAKESLSGPQKCAMLCMALGAKEAGKSCNTLQPEEVELVAREIAAMPAVPTRHRAVRAPRVPGRPRARRPPSPAGGVDYAQQILEQALGAARGRDDPRADRRSQRTDSGLMKLREGGARSARRHPARRAPADHRAHPRPSRPGAGFGHRPGDGPRAGRRACSTGVARMEKVSPDIARAGASRAGQQGPTSR